MLLSFIWPQSDSVVRCEGGDPYILIHPKLALKVVELLIIPSSLSPPPFLADAGSPAW